MYSITSALAVNLLILDNLTHIYHFETKDKKKSWSYTPTEIKLINLFIMNHFKHCSCSMDASWASIKKALKFDMFFAWFSGGWHDSTLWHGVWVFHYPTAGETATVGCSRVPFQHGGGSTFISLSVGFLFCVSLFFVLVLFSFVFILFRGSCLFIIFFSGIVCYDLDSEVFLCTIQLV